MSGDCRLTFSLFSHVRTRTLLRTHELRNVFNNNINNFLLRDFLKRKKEKFSKCVRVRERKATASVSKRSELVERFV